MRRSFRLVWKRGTACPSHPTELAPETRYTIGRSTECSVVLPDPAVSRMHAALIVRPHDIVVLDLNSKAGVAVNGIKVREQVLKEGDTIAMGPYEAELTAVVPANDNPARPHAARQTRLSHPHIGFAPPGGLLTSVASSIWSLAGASRAGSSSFLLAGMLALLFIVCAIPLAVNGIKLFAAIMDGASPARSAKIVQGLSAQKAMLLPLFLLSAVANFLLLMALKDLLHRRYRFQECDTLFDWAVLALTGFISTFAVTVGFSLSASHPIQWLLWGTGLAAAATGIALFFKLLNLNGDLFGLKAVLCVSGLVASLSLPAIIAQSAAIVFPMAYMMVLALIFFRAAHAHTDA